MSPKTTDNLYYKIIIDIQEVRGVENYIIQGVTIKKLP